MNLRSRPRTVSDIIIDWNIARRVAATARAAEHAAERALRSCLRDARAAVVDGDRVYWLDGEEVRSLAATSSDLVPVPPAGFPRPGSLEAAEFGPPVPGFGASDRHLLAYPPARPTAEACVAIDDIDDETA